MLLELFPVGWISFRPIIEVPFRERRWVRPAYGGAGVREHVFEGVLCPYGATLSHEA